MSTETKIIDNATNKLKQVTEEKMIETIWERYSQQLPQCGFGLLGLCCKNCNFGPCRIDPFGEGPQTGICGADADVISARNLLRNTAVGAACHSDHGRELAHTLLLVSEGKAEGYKIVDKEKLIRVAKEFGISTDNKSENVIAKELAIKMLEEFGKQEGEILFCKTRPPQKQQKIWAENKILPRGIDREIVEAMARTHMGVDNEYKNILFHT
ncbi:MAG: carbon monoxide dehydrogenase, partial [Endomicrobiia bacterium]